MSSRILLVEDDPRQVTVLREALDDIGFHLDDAADGITAFEMTQATDYALVILDIGLPRLNGIELCKRIRAHNRQVPILFLTSRAEEIDKILGLELGADDYLTKPYSVRELAARTKALLRRGALGGGGSVQPAAAAEVDEIVIGEIAINLLRRTVAVRGAPVDLTASEYDLLVFLASSPGRAYSRDELLSTVLGYQSAGYENTVTSHLSRLRAKVELDRDNPRYILTVKGVGYRFVAPDELDGGS